MQRQAAFLRNAPVPGQGMPCRLGWGEVRDMVMGSRLGG